MNSKFLVCALFAIVIACVSANGPDLVQTVFRHGSRGPLNPAPHYAAQLIEAGVYDGQLTKDGAKMLRAFGALMASRYKGTLVNNTYIPNQLHVRSTDFDRTLMSVGNLLAAFYPDQPIPVHTVPLEADNLLQALSQCPSYNLEMSAADARAEQRLKSNATWVSIVEELEQWAGWTHGAHSMQWVLDTWLDNYYCLTSVRIPLEKMDRLRVLEPIVLKFLMEVNYDRFAMKGADDPRGAVCGPLVNEWMNNIQSVLNAKAEINNPIVSPSRLHFYSAHDTTVLAFTNGLGLLTPESPMLYPQFATSYVMEFYKTSATDGVVKMLVGHTHSDGQQGWTYDVTPVPLNCPTSKTDCTYSELKAYFAKLIKPNGCCVRTEGFKTHGCDQYTTPTDKLQGACQTYRRWCAAEACDTNEFLIAPTPQVCMHLTKSP